MHNTQRWEDIYNQINGAYIPGVCEGVGDGTDSARPERQGRNGR